MPVEIVNYISDFNPAWPEGDDIRRFGDDHIRNIKVGILGSFSGFLPSTDPGFEAMVRTQAELNSVVNRVLRAGDTMTGALKGHQVNPTADLDFVTKKWVQDLYDGAISGGGSGYGFGIVERFVSTEASLSANNTQSFPHGLTEAPSEIILRLRCTSANAGYSVNDVLLMNGPQSADTVNNLETGGIQSAANDSDIWWTVGARVWTVAKSSGAFTQINLSSWRGTLIGYVIA